MDVLYIGHYNDGSTSKMRGELLKEILQPSTFTIVNIDASLKATNRFFRTLGWRYKIGPLISNINNQIISVINNKWNFDLVWVDKGVFIDPEIIMKLRGESKKMIHFTPDPAFTYHQSALFYKAIRYYDACITTKSFEQRDYQKAGAKQVILTTQGFQPDLHKPYHYFEQKSGIVFIGHHEKDREVMVQALLQKNFPITIAGIGWSSFVKNNERNKNLIYLGNGIFGTEYAKAISSGLISLGFLSKIVPELHTTRTFEIPACGTALATERNSETQNIFNEDEVLFFSNTSELVSKVVSVFNNRELLKDTIEKGMKKVREGKYDYKAILQNLLIQFDYD